MAAGKPTNGTGPHCIPTVLGTVDRLISNLQKHVQIGGWNISTDNYYTSLPLAEYLMLKNVTTVGTIKGNRRGIPKGLLDVKSREKYSYEAYWDKKKEQVQNISMLFTKNQKVKRTF